MDRNPRFPKFVDKGTSQSFKETFCAAVLLWVIRHSPPGASPAPTPFKSARRTGALLLIVYVTARHDPSQILR